MQNSSEIHYLPIHAVKPYVRSARTHSPKQRRKLNALLRKFGQVAPIIVDDNNVIVNGHAVYAGLVELGFDEIAAVVVRNHDPAEIRALRLALNRLPRETGWDRGVLRDELQDLPPIRDGANRVRCGRDRYGSSRRGIGDRHYCARCCRGYWGASSPVVRCGDIYRLGRHLIACGDARDGALLRRLVGGRAVHVVFAAPPRIVPIGAFVSGVGKLRQPKPTMASAEMTQDFTSFLTDSMEALVPVLNNRAILFFCLDWRHMRELLDAAGCHRLAVKDLCIWAKSSASAGALYHSQHELVFVLKHSDAPRSNISKPRSRARTRSNLWSYGEVNALEGDGAVPPGMHPTVKPVAMIADALKDVSKRGDLVLDPFLGSGSTLIAAEETGRTCVAIERDPGAIQDAIRRWETRTGQTAVHADTGETLADAMERLRTTGPEARLGPADPRGEVPHG